MSQTQAILDYLKAGNAITPIEALERFGVFRLGARIADLRASGEDIVTQIVERGNKRFAKYILIPKEGALCS